MHHSKLFLLELELLIVCVIRAGRGSDQALADGFLFAFILIRLLAPATVLSSHIAFATTRSARFLDAGVAPTAIDSRSNCLVTWRRDSVTSA